MEKPFVELSENCYYDKHSNYYELNMGFSEGKKKYLLYSIPIKLSYMAQPYSRCSKYLGLEIDISRCIEPTRESDGCIPCTTIELKETLRNVSQVFDYLFSTRFVKDLKKSIQRHRNLEPKYDNLENANDRLYDLIKILNKDSAGTEIGRLKIVNAFKSSIFDYRELPSIPFIKGMNVDDFTKLVDMSATLQEQIDNFNKQTSDLAKSIKNRPSVDADREKK